MSESQPVSWRSLIYGTPVLSADGAQAGTIREVLGSDGEDVFHGLRVRLAQDRRDVMITADAIDSLATDEVRSFLSQAEIAALPTFDEHATYHLASVGWLRKHVGWAKDAKSDEEPG